MAKCPKCGHKLHLYDWRPECPNCHVNLVYYDSNEKLLAESEKAEIEHAKFQPKIDRAKTATIGSKEGIIRMVLFLIPIAALFLPIFKIAVSEKAKNYNAIDIYNAFSSLDIAGILKNISPVVIAVLLVAVPAVCCIVFTIMQIASCSKKGLKRNIVLSCISIFLVLASIVSFCIFSAKPWQGYLSLVVNEAGTAAVKGDQNRVDEAVQKLYSLYGEETVNGMMLESTIAEAENAIENGEKLLGSAEESGLTKEEQSALEKSIDDGKNILSGDKIDAASLKDAADKINRAYNTYTALQAAVDAAEKSGLENEDGVYSDECLKVILAETEKATDRLQKAVDRAKKIVPDGILSERSFDKLNCAVSAAQECLDTLKAGKAVVELTDDDGTGDKTEKELAIETAQFVQDKFNDLNDAVCLLADASAVSPLVDKAACDIVADELEESENISVSLGAGIFVLLALYIIQLIYNIILNKKGIEVKYTECLIGGLPSDEYFKMVEDGVSELEIRKKMVESLTKMQDEVRAKAAHEEEEALKKAMDRK